MSRLRSQDGFTLPELITAMAMGTIILLGAFGLLDTAMRRTTETQLKVEATQRGRQALDLMTRQLRSQVCLTTSTPAVVDATPTSVTFYADLSSGTGAAGSQVQKRTLAYDAGTRTIVESVHAPVVSGGTVTHPGPPVVKELLANVVPDGSESMFRYYAYTAPTATAAPTPDLELVSPNATDRARIARIDLRFVVLGAPGSTASSRTSLPLRDRVTVRAANPNDPAPYPICA